MNYTACLVIINEPGGRPDKSQTLESIAQRFHCQHAIEYDIIPEGSRSLGEGGLRQRAKNVLRDLMRNRRSALGNGILIDCETLVFIGYGLGGLLLKQIILLAATSSQYKMLSQSTDLLVFFGTPHRKSTAASIQEFIFRMVSSLELSEIDPASLVLSFQSALPDLESDFNRMLNKNYDMVNFVEVNEGWDHGTIAANEYCSTTGVPGEDNIQVACGHAQPWTTVFSRRRVTDVIIKKVEQAVEAKRKVNLRSQYQDFLERLGGYTIANSLPLSTWNQPLVPGSMDWVRETGSFSSWIGASGSSVLHIMGQPGSGTTVLSSRIIELLGSKSNATPILASFTVGVVPSASSLSQTTEMLVALSQQLLLLKPNAFQGCSGLCSWIMRIPRVIVTETIAWSLLRCVVSAIRDPICFLIRHFDLLSPTSGWEHALVKLSHIGRPGQPLQILVTTVSPLTPAVARNCAATPQENFSEAWVNACRRFTDYDNSPPGRSFCGVSYLPVSLDGHQALLVDIEKWVRERVYRWIQEKGVWSNFEDEVVSKICVPGTTYLLAKQQVGYLQSSFSHTSKSELRRCLNTLPLTHDTLYMSTLESLPKLKRDWAMVALAWIGLSFRCLDSSELALALVFEHGDIQELETIRQNLSFDIHSDLTRVIEPFFKTVGNQFHPIHRSIGPITSLSGYGPKFHANATFTCLKYLSIILSCRNTIGPGGKLTDELDNNVECGFLSYSVIHWPDHYRNALSTHNRDFVIRTQTLLEKPGLLSTWSQLYGIFTSSFVSEWQEPAAPLSSVLNVACRFGLLPLAKECSVSQKDSLLVSEAWENALNLASQFGHADIVSWIIQNGTTSADALSLAAAGGHVDVVGDLIANGSNIGHKDRGGYPVMLRAAEHGHINVLSQLLNGKGKEMINETAPDGSSALHMAARIGHLDGVQKLIAEGASVMQENQAGYIPLHLAAAGGFSDIIFALTPGPMSLTKKTGVEDGAHTPLHLAALSGNTEACRQLLMAGPVTLLAIQNGRGWTPLHVAARGGYLDTIQLFLGKLDEAVFENQAKGVDSAEENEDILAVVADELPATLAAANGHVAVMMELLNYLVKKRQPPDSTIQTNQFNDLKEAVYCLWEAVRNGQVNAIKQLLQVGVDASSTDPAGNTALQLAARGNDLAVVETLLNEALPKQEDKNAALVLAVLSENIPITRKLIDNGAKVRETNNYNELRSSALHAAAEKGNEVLLSELLQTVAGRELFIDVIDDLVSRAATNGHKNFIQTLFALSKEMELVSARRKESDEHSYEIHDVDDDAVSGRDTGKDNDEKGDRRFFQRLLTTFQAWDDSRAVRVLLEAGFPCDFRDVDNSPLHLAARYGHDTVINSLIAHGVDIEQKARAGDTALIIAAAKGHVSTCNCLLNLGADVDGTNDKKATALIVACRAGSRNLVELLLEHRADISATDANDVTPLHAAVGTPDVVRFLLGRKPKPDTNVPDAIGRTPLLEAIAIGSLESTDLLLMDGVSLDNENRKCLHQAIKSRHPAIVKRLLEKGANCDTYDSESPMPLHLAAETAFPEAVEYLIPKISDINSLSGDYGTALSASVAGAYSYRENGLRCAEILISNKADVNRYGGAYHSPLQTAAWFEVEELVKLFIDRGAEVDATGGIFTTALNAAVECDRVDLTKMLLDAGASPTVELKNGPHDTILSRAIAVSNEEMVETLLSVRGEAVPQEALEKALRVAAREDKLSPFKLLLHKGALAGFKDSGLPPILFDAISSSGESVLDYLLGEGRNYINVDEVDVHGTTALAYAIAGDYYYVDDLLEAGADPNIADKAGNTPLILAARAENEAFIQSLLGQGRATRIDSFDFAGRGALYWACYSRNEDLFDAVIKFLGQESVKDHSLALHAAAARGMGSMLDLLLSSGANPSCLDRNNWSVLRAGKEYNAPGMVERLPVIRVQPQSSGLKRPTSWNRLETHKQLEVSDDGLSITLKRLEYATNTRSDFCMPNDASVYYFEVTIEKIVQRDGETSLAEVGVGFFEEHVSLDRMVGWDNGSWGYHSDNGKLYTENKPAAPEYGEYGEGTTIGCGVDFRDHTAFFTKNGTLLGNGFQDIRGKLYPAASFGRNIAAGSIISVNFGENPNVKFKYDLPSNPPQSNSGNPASKPESASGSGQDKMPTRKKRKLKRTDSILS